MVNLARALLFSEILLSSIYIISFKVNFVRVIAASILILVFVLGVGNKKLKPSTRSLIIWALTFVFFKYIVDSVFHSVDPFDALIQLIKEMVIILLLPAFERIGSANIKPVKMIVIAGIPACLLGLLQIYSPIFTIDELIPPNSIFLTEGITASYIRAENRIVGPYTLAIGFALFLGFLFMQLLAYGFNKNNKVKFILTIGYSLIVIALVIATQTRSAIYGLPLAAMFSFLICDIKNFKKWTVGLMLGALVLTSYAFYESFVVKYSDRSSLEIDANTYYKITANIYGTFAALNKNYLIGVPRFNRDDPASYGRYKELIREGKRKLGSIVDNKQQYNLMATNHNMFAFYLRHYGVLGFVLLIVVLWKIYKKISVKCEVTDKFMLYGIGIYFLQYVLFHNPQLFEELLIWVLLANGVEKTDDSKNTTNQRADVCLQ